MSDKTEKWVLTGYETFALYGLQGLKVEKLSKDVGVSKSSFYHHFADLEIFLDQLLEHHLAQAEVVAEKERKAKKINPDLITILIDHKIDLLFNRQLRINANNEKFKAVLSQSTKIIGTDFVRLWLEDTKLNVTTQQAEGLFELAMENFFLQINKDTIHAKWLETYFDNLYRLTRNFENTAVR